MSGRAVSVADSLFRPHPEQRARASREPQTEQKLKRKERSRKDKQAERPRKQNDTQARNMTMNPKEDRVIGTS